MDRPADGRNQAPVRRAPVTSSNKGSAKPANVPAARKTAPSGKNTKKPVQRPDQKSVKQQGNIIKALMIFVIILLIALLAVRAVLFFKDETDLLNTEVTIEAGTVKPDIGMYFKEEPAFPQLVSCNLNFDEVNTDLPQTVRFNIRMYGINHSCRLIIQDTVPPAAEAVLQKIFACEELPDALTCVMGITDITDVTASWKDVPDISEGGDYLIPAVLTDGCGNETEVMIPFEVTKDSVPPVITGALDIEYYIGDSVAYKKNIKVTDDYDEDPVLDIDVSDVDMETEGTYDVVYTARDFSGNETSVTVKIHVMEKPENYIEPEVVYEAAKEILDEITEPGMTEEEIALQIIWWCRYNIKFILKTDYNSWTEAAYSAYTLRYGNCYATAYAVKALLDVAGFENMIIERWPYETATHFWNYVLINGQWYHCDATWREGYDSYFFMYTTEELHDFWQGGWNGFQYRQDEYPESATESVQSRIDYKNHTMKE